MQAVPPNNDELVFSLASVCAYLARCCCQASSFAKSNRVMGEVLPTDAVGCPASRSRRDALPRLTVRSCRAGVNTMTWARGVIEGYDV